MAANESINQPAMRKSNLELFRIITMILIIAHHYVVNSGLTDVNGPIASNPLSIHSLFLLLWGAWGKTGINCFVLFSGYFMCQKNITFKKFLKLLCEVMFYRIVIAGIFWISGYEPFTLKELVKELLPVRELSSDFISTYLVFFLFIPFLNILIHHMNEKQHLYLLLLVSFAYIFLETLKPVFYVVKNYTSWYMVLYFISSYIRLYPKKIFDSKKFWGTASLLCVFVSSLSVIVCAWLGTKMGRSFYYDYVTDSNTLLAVLTGLCAFMYFRNLNIPQSKFINTVAGTTFGVLCIHAHIDTMRKWLWQDVFNNVGFYYQSTGCLHAVLTVIIVFIVCSIIDLVRIRVLEKPFLQAIDKPLNTLTLKYKKAENRILTKLGIEPGK